MPTHLQTKHRYTPATIQLFPLDPEELQTKPAPEHPVYPYLLRNVKVIPPNQV